MTKRAYLVRLKTLPNSKLVLIETPNYAKYNNVYDFSNKK